MTYHLFLGNWCDTKLEMNTTNRVHERAAEHTVFPAKWSGIDRLG